VLYVGRDAPGKGVGVLLAAWARAALPAPEHALVLAGPPDRPGAIGPQTPEQVRNLLAASRVLVVPSVRTRTFREPWGLVVNEAMHQGTPVIATTEVGAAAGGLVRHGRNGLVVPAGDADALAAALRRVARDPALAARFGAAAHEDVAPYTFEAWAEGVARALAAAGAEGSSGGCDAAGAEDFPVGLPGGRAEDSPVGLPEGGPQDAPSGPLRAPDPPLA